MMTSMLVTSVFHTKIGMRNIVRPGARIVKIVVMKLTPPRIVPRPDIHRPMTHRSPPMPGELTASLSGAYANQPKLAAPPGTKNPDTTIVEPNR